MLSGLEINTGKTLVFYQPTVGGNNLNPCIEVADSIVGCCSDFCYLGSNLTTDLTLDKELSSRIAKASTAFCKLRKRAWENHHLKVDTKVSVYRAVVLATVLYGSET